MYQQFPGLDPQDWATIEPYYAELNAAALTPDTLYEWLQRWSALEAQLSEHGFRAYRATSENTADTEAEQRFMHLIEAIIPKQRVASQQLIEKLLAADRSALPPATSELVRRFEAEAALFREANIPLFTELERLENEFSKIMGAMTVELHGTTLTMQQAAKHFSDQDRAVREEAWRAYMQRFSQDRAQINELFLRMLKLRRQIAENADMPDFRAYMWQRYGRFDYSPADCITFHDAIEHEVVPLAKKWLDQRQQSLGLATVRPWDVEVDPLNRPALQPFQTGEELEAGGERIFQQVDPQLGEYYQRMRDGYLDLESRPGKAPGGYCGGMMVTGVPYIFMNAVGTHDDVQTLLHEGGHAFHFFESSQNNDLMWNYDGPIEFCEVASMAMELLAAPYLESAKGGFYSSAEARQARSEHLLGMLNFWPYMAVVDAFQHWVYTTAPVDVTAEQLDAQWAELAQRFMPGVDWSGLEAIQATGWHRKQHIFSSPFYYVEYGLAQLGALQVWRNALADQQSAVEQYRSALALGNTRPLAQLFEAAGARFAFDRQTVGELARLIDQHLEMLQPA